MITGTYISDGLFDLNPAYDEHVQYDFEKEKFIPSAQFEDEELDFDAMYTTVTFTKDRNAYDASHRRDC